MADPNPPPPTNWGPAPPTPQGWPPASSPTWSAPPGWTPAPPPHVPYWARPGAMEQLSRLTKLVGLGLVVLGILIVVIGASVPGSCTTSNCSSLNGGSNWVGGALWALLVGKLIAVLGLGALCLGSLLKLRYGDAMPTSGKRDDLDFVLADRRWNGLLFVISLLLLFVVLVLTVLAPAGGFLGFVGPLG